MKILAIGGAVIKTARTELLKIVARGDVEMLIHNGGSLFHDFQRATDSFLRKSGRHSYTLDELVDNPDINKEDSQKIWDWLYNSEAPSESVTQLCQEMGIPVLLFTITGADFWQLWGSEDDWAKLGRIYFKHFEILRNRFKTPFHYICMGSAVIHPEIFTKAIAGMELPKFQADVVDFRETYRPRTRIAKYGEYFLMTHKEYLEKWKRENA